MLLKSNISKAGQIITAKASALVPIVVLTALMLIACSRTPDLQIGKPQLNPDGSQSEWVPVSSKHGHFKILMPGTPTVTTDTTARPPDSLTTYSLNAVDISQPALYTFNFTELPRGAELCNSVQTLENIRNDLLRKGNRLIGDRQINASGREVTELVAEDQSGQFHTVFRYYPLKTSFYSAIITMQNDIFVSPSNYEGAAIASNQMARFFDSIEFTK